MKLKLRTRYALVLVSLIIFISFLLAGSLFFHLKSSVNELTNVSSENIKTDLMNQMEQRGKIIVHFLAESLIDPLYHYDLQSVYDLLSIVLEQKDVLYVLVYDMEGKLIHDGVEEIPEFGKVIADEEMKKAIVKKQLLKQVLHNNTLEISFPIWLGELPLGGVKVGLTLVSINSDIQRTQNRLENISKAGLREDIIFIFLITTVLVISGILFSFFIAGQLIHPIRKLSDYSKEVGKGNYNVQITSQRTDEIGDLINSFNQMVQNLKQSEGEIKKSEKRYREIFVNSPISLWEEDFSEAKTYIDSLRKSGVTDFRGYFTKHPEEMKKCAGMVKILDVNKATTELLQYTKEELLADLLKIFKEESYTVFIEELAALAEGKRVFESVAVNQTKSGDRLSVNLRMIIVPGHENTWSKVLVSIIDITKRKEAEDALRQHVQELRILNNIGKRVSSTLSRETVVRVALEEVTVSVDPDFIVLYLKQGDDLVQLDMIAKDPRFMPEVPKVKKVGYCLCGLAATGEPAYSINIHHDSRCVLKECKEVGIMSFAALPLKSRDSVIGVLGLASTKERDFSKKTFFLETISNEIAIGLQNALLHEETQKHTLELEKINKELIAEISARKLTEERLTQSLGEKELLLQEVFHRTKNNMQVISSILLLQSTSIKDEKLLDIIQDCQHRIKSMALVHEKLCLTKDLSNIDIEEYITALIKSLFDSYNVDKEKISLETDVEKLILDIDTSIPLGLIINELLSNSLKHAFDSTQKGTIHLTLTSLDRDEFELKISDDGVGFPEGFDFQNTESLGLQIVKLLVEHQLQGKINLSNEKGAKFQIVFQRTKYKKRV
jgi:PAS domain S-box-containing protein